MSRQAVSFFFLQPAGHLSRQSMSRVKVDAALVKKAPGES
jgi:hypothetical protein